MPGGKVHDLKNLLFHELGNAQIPLRVSAVMWQNSIPSLTLVEVKDIIQEIEVKLNAHPQHKVALPECQFVPAQANHFEHIAKINMMLADFNKRQGFNRYPLFKSTMHQSRKGLTVKQGEWLEYQKKMGPGYHIADKKNFTRFIRMFHLNNLENPKYALWRPSTLDITKVLAVISPPNKMEDPSDTPKDLRETLRVKRQLGLNYYHDLGYTKPKSAQTSLVESYSPKRPRLLEEPIDMEEEIEVTIQNADASLKTSTHNTTEYNTGNKASTSVKVSNDENEDPAEDILRWYDSGAKKGYTDIMFSAIRTKMRLEKKRKEKTRKEDKKREDKKKKDKKREDKKKKDKKRKHSKTSYNEPSSDSSTESSTESSSDSSTESSSSSSSSSTTNHKRVMKKRKYNECLLCLICQVMIMF